jgi:hypothetical protein
MTSLNDMTFRYGHRQRITAAYNFRNHNIADPLFVNALAVGGTTLARPRSRGFEKRRFKKLLDKF